jgi:hypothetical protein
LWQILCNRKIGFLSSTRSSCYILSQLNQTLLSCLLKRALYVRIPHVHIYANRCKL